MPNNKIVRELAEEKSFIKFKLMKLEWLKSK
jgi:hypothetical protein